MKRIKGILIFLCLGLVLVLCGTQEALAKDNTLYFTADKGSISWNGDMTEDGCGHIKFQNLLPGETYEEEIAIENLSSVTQKLYMEVSVPDEDGIAKDLLDTTIVTITQDGSELFKGPISDFKAVTPFYLGLYGQEKTSVIKLSLSIDKNLDLRYSGAATSFEFVFTTAQATEGKGLFPAATADILNDGKRYLALGTLFLAAGIGCFIIRRRQEL